MLPDYWGSDMDYRVAMGTDADEVIDCEVCEWRVAVLRDPFSGEYRCESCEDNHQQDAYDRQQEQDFADFHGGVAPQHVYDATCGKVR